MSRATGGGILIAIRWELRQLGRYQALKKHDTELAKSSVAIRFQIVFSGTSARPAAWSRGMILA